MFKYTQSAKSQNLQKSINLLILQVLRNIKSFRSVDKIKSFEILIKKILKEPTDIKALNICRTICLAKYQKYEKLHIQEPVFDLHFLLTLKYSDGPKMSKL